MRDKYAHCVLVGDFGVGKTTLSNKFLSQRIDNAFDFIDADFQAIDLEHKDQTTHLSIWDTRAQERFRMLPPQFFRKAAVVIFVYAVDSRDSFRNLTMWHTEAQRHISAECRTMLVGNKADSDNERKVTREEGLRLREQLGINEFCETRSDSFREVEWMFYKAVFADFD